MRSYLVTTNGGFRDLSVVDRDTGDVGPNDVLVRMTAASLNYRDFGITRGGYLRNDRCPVVPLSDGVGEVVSIGREVTKWSVGDRVAGSFVQDWVDGSPTDETLRTSLGGGIDGVLCEERVFPEHGLVRVPQHLSDEEAACLPCAAVTAWHAIMESGQLAAGQTVLTLGTGGVSTFAIQIAKAAGARVIATSSSDDKLVRATELGASDVINYRSHDDWHRVAREMTDGRGVDQVVEVGGPGTLAKSLQAAAVGGHIGLIGVLAGTDGDINPVSALFNVVRISGIYVGSRAMFERLNDFLTEHQIRPVVDRVFSFDDAIAAYEYLKSGNHFGKVVIRIAK